MKTLFVTAIVVLAFSVTGSAQKCTEYTLPGKAFAFCPPAGFKLVQTKGSKKVEFESTSGAASITVLGTTRTETRAAMQIALINGTFGADTFKNARLIKLADMKLPSGLDASMLSFFFELDAVPMAVGYLLVDGPNKTTADFSFIYRRDDAATGLLINNAMETLRAK